MLSFKKNSQLYTLCTRKTETYRFLACLQTGKHLGFGELQRNGWGWGKRADKNVQFSPLLNTQQCIYTQTQCNYAKWKSTNNKIFTIHSQYQLFLWEFQRESFVRWERGCGSLHNDDTIKCIEFRKFIFSMSTNLLLEKLYCCLVLVHTTALCMSMCFRCEQLETPKAELPNSLAC